VELQHDQFFAIILIPFNSLGGLDHHEYPRSREVPMAFCTSCGSSVDGEFCGKCGARVAGPAPAEPQQSVPDYVPPVHQTPAPGAPKKSRFLIWVLLGCGGLIVIAGIIAISTGVFVAYKAKQAGLDPALVQKNPGLAVAKMVASMSPDTEVLSVDEDRGIIRVRDKKTGKMLTMNLEDAKNGKIVFLDENDQKVEIQTRGEGDNASVEVQGPDGTMRMGTMAANLPDWLPSYPGAEGKGTYDLNTKDGKAGSYSFQTSDSAESVGRFYEDALKKAGFEVQKNLTQVPGQGSMIILAGTDSASQRTVQVTAASQGEGAHVSLAFEVKK
jgi:hypothetical protein